jgi:hypothetical protein
MWIKRPEMWLVMLLEIALTVAIMWTAKGHFTMDRTYALVMVYGFVCSLRGQRIYRLAEKAKGPSNG